MVSPNNDDGTVNTLETQDETLFGFIEAIGAYKYPTLFSIKGNESVNKNIEILGCKISKCPPLLLL